MLHESKLKEICTNLINNYDLLDVKFFNLAGYVKDNPINFDESTPSFYREVAQIETMIDEIKKSYDRELIKFKNDLKDSIVKFLNSPNSLENRETTSIENKDTTAVCYLCGYTYPLSEVLLFYNGQNYICKDCLTQK